MGDAEAARALLSAQAVRERAHEMLAAGLRGELAHFTVDLESLGTAAHVVSELIRVSYPDGNVPFHARWRHFVLGGRDLWAELAAQTAWASPAAKARAAFDLAHHLGAARCRRRARLALSRSRDRAGRRALRGAGVASLRMFEAGAFSADPADPLRADAERLMHLKSDDVAHGIPSMVGNRLVGVEGRAALLARLGAAVAAKPRCVRARGSRRGRAGCSTISRRRRRTGASRHRASSRPCSKHLGPIWPGRLTLGGVPLGDTWRHPAIKRGDATNGLVPFHKLSQWLSYSLIEPLQWSGIAVTDIDGLTGLAEYRNGGLFVDAGVLRLRNPEEAIHPNRSTPSWWSSGARSRSRCSTRSRRWSAQRLGLTIDDFPLARVLEGGTWAAGRRLAREKRPDGGAADCGRERRHRILISFSLPREAGKGWEAGGLACKTSPSSIIRWCSTS